MDISLLFIILMSSAIGTYLCISFYNNVIKLPKPRDKEPDKLLSIDNIDGIRKIGKFQDGTKPGPGVEHLCKSDFTVQRVILGKYGGNTLSYDDVIYTCPKCKKQHTIKFQHGDVWKCGCGLIAQSHGNGLDVWE